MRSIFFFKSDVNMIFIQIMKTKNYCTLLYKEETLFDITCDQHDFSNSMHKHVTNMDCAILFKT